MMHTADSGSASQEVTRVQNFEGQLRVQCKVELTMVMAWAVLAVALLEQDTSTA